MNFLIFMLIFDGIDWTIMDDLGLNGRKMRSFCGNRSNIVVLGIEWMEI